MVLKEHFGKGVSVKLDSWILPDNWKWGQRLIKGDSFSEFRIPIPNPIVIKDLAVIVEITGRTARRIAFGEYRVRVKITFPGDGEPDTITYGWMKLE